MVENSTKWELLQENRNSDLDKLFKLYSEDKLKARVYFFNKGNHSFIKYRLVLYEHGNGDFELVNFKVKFGISISSKMYSRESKESSVVYKGGKFYYLQNKKVIQLTFNNLITLDCNFFIGDKRLYYNNSLNINNCIYLFLVKRFGWIRFIGESDIFHNVSFNSIIRNKLYNRNDLLRHMFKCSLPLVKTLLKAYKGYTIKDLIKIWLELRKVLINIDNLTLEFICNEHFSDTTRMARMLGEKVNCSWGLKRLELEHNNFSRRVGSILIECEDLVELNVNKLHYLFEEFSGYKLLKTNRDLSYEGYVMNHCVGTYSNKVNNDKVGIYHIKGYTFELIVSSVSTEINARNIYNSNHYNNYTLWLTTNKNSDIVRGLRIVQYRGKYNKLAPFELFNEVFNKVVEFNLKIYNATNDLRYINKIDGDILDEILF